MKIIILCLILSSFALSAQEVVMDLSAENLTMLVLKSSPVDVVDEFITKKMKSDHAKEYYKTLKNKTGKKELYRRVQENLEKQLLNVSDQQVFKFSKKIRYSIDNDKLSSIHINDLFPDVVHTIFRDYTALKGFPDYFNLLMTNLEILDHIEIKEKNLSKIQQKEQKTIWAEVILTVSNYQNQLSFQTVIKRIDLYTDKTKKQLLGSVTEDRGYNEIVDAWLLSDGFTTKLVGIHAFSVLGYRLQDRITKSLVLSNYCEKPTKINKHQVLVCIHSYTQHSKVIAIFIGGILAQLDLVINNKLEASEKQTIISHLKNGLNRNRSKFKNEQKLWEKHFVDFAYYPSAFNTQKNSGANNPNKYKLIFSMASQATNRLFEVKQ